MRTGNFRQGFFILTVGARLMINKALERNLYWCSYWIGCVCAMFVLSEFFFALEKCISCITDYRVEIRFWMNFVICITNTCENNSMVKKYVFFLLRASPGENGWISICIFPNYHGVIIACKFWISMSKKIYIPIE